MAKLYSKHSKPQKKQDFKLNPKDETVGFILSYSKALRVINYKNITFETLQN